MSHDLMSQFYGCFNLPLHERIMELSRIIEVASPNKDLQTLFPQLVNNIFASSLNNGWGLNSVTYDGNRNLFEMLISFLEPQGPMFQLCYKLLSDPQLKYNLPLNILPLDLQVTLERGRCPQFYADLLTVDPQSLKLNVVGLSLNPFDYYIFNFALYLISNNQNKTSWENWNSVYFALACDYLTHFLPTDPNVPVLPHIPHYTGKVPMVAPLQTANRPLGSPSLLLIPDLSGISNQHASAQTQSRNEVWRSETVLQVFIDIWMSIEQYTNGNIDNFQQNYPVLTSSPERVRTVRVLVKHIHSFSAKYLTDLATRSSALRKYARQIMCARAYHYVKHLVTTWPLDASFRLVIELWLSLIQPWRYMDNAITQERFPRAQPMQEEGNSNTLDASYTQFIAENFPTYTCIFQMVLPRFMRLDLTTYKNAVMLFRLGKVFSQQHLIPILWNLEKAMMDNTSSLQHSPDNSYNNISTEHSYTYNGISLSKWVAIAKQSISELNVAANFEYSAIWSENKKPYMMEFVKKIHSAKLIAEKNVEEFNKRINQQQQGFWATVKHWLLIVNKDEDELLFEEIKKVPDYLNNCIHYFCNIFGVNDNMLLSLETGIEEVSQEDVSFDNTTNFAQSITNKLRSNPTSINYMGDPDLMPITSYENTILVRMFYQIATRLNEIYGEQFNAYWNRDDLCGYVSREVLQRPCSVQSYVRSAEGAGCSGRSRLLRRDLPARLSLRRLASHACCLWLAAGYALFLFFSNSLILYVIFIFIMWTVYILMKASLKMIKIIKDE
ncbi:PREDICTED: sphingomyelin phosphodiesterase 4 isoform X2 [Papilio polytes]|uniref:sphingomyelin phosphodiesterase 4 isoform X2 n=1 Tax=Papilio polytes TaxID=76194 RepID=UPI000675DDCC|nr:PREDICTED: sphingomyelin phosphodiesterase 4 isoform X2 [Papilio polytes]